MRGVQRGGTFDAARRHKRFGTSAVFLATLTLMLGTPMAAPPPVRGQTPTAGLPEGEGRDKVQFHCSICHDLAIVKQQRLPPSVWDEVLDDMRNWGAVFDDAEREVILAYLAERFGP